MILRVSNFSEPDPNPRMSRPEKSDFLIIFKDPIGFGAGTIPPLTRPALASVMYIFFKKMYIVYIEKETFLAFECLN